MAGSSAHDDSTAQVLASLVTQLRFYFSDANLRRDRFLRQLVGPLGMLPVPVSTLSGFNRVLALTREEGTVLAALRGMPDLEVSADGLTVVRRRPLPPPEDDSALLRTVYFEPVAVGSTIESVQQLFACCGDVAFVSLPCPDAPKDHPSSQTIPNNAKNAPL